MKEKNKNIMYIKYISIIILFIFVLFIAIDLWSGNLNNKYSTYLKFSSILLCFILSLLISSNIFNAKDIFLLKLARFFTIIADYFLLISGNYILGVLFFCLVQLTYIRRHSLMQKGVLNIKINRILIIPLSILILMLLSFIMHITNSITLLISISLVYGFLLILSVYCGIRTLKSSYYPKNNSLFISLGLILFLMCDINVALYQIIKYGFFSGVSSNIHFIIGLFIWIFYLPSQLLLSLSGIKNLYRIF